MSNVDLQKNPVEGFSAGLVDDNIYEVNIQDKSIVICFFFQPIAEQFFIFFFAVGNPCYRISRHLVVKYIL